MKSYLMRALAVSAFCAVYLGAEVAYSQWCGGGGGSSSSGSARGSGGGSTGGGSGGGSSGGTRGSGGGAGSSGGTSTGSETAKPITWVNGTPVVPTQTTGAVDVNAPTGPTKPDVQETELAASQAKPALLYFYWPNVEDPAGDACRQLDAKLWVDGQVCTLAQEYVCIKVNGKTCPKQVLTVFGVKSFPTIVFEVCSKKIVTTVRSKSVEPGAFATAMKSVSAANSKVAVTMKAQSEKLDLQVEAAGKLIEDGKLDAAEKAFRKLLKDAPESDQAGAARAGLDEITCRRQLAKGQEFLKAEKFAEARSFLQMAADCAVPNVARDQARELLPDCEFGLQFSEACQKLASGDNLGAMEAFTKIAGDGSYEGKFKKLAVDKLQEMKNAWNQKTK